MRVMAELPEYVQLHGNTHRHGTDEPGWVEHDHVGGGLPHGHDRETGVQVPIPRPEAVAAAAWWASRLGNASHDIGDRTAGERESSALAGFVTAMRGKVFTDEQREAFRRELAICVEQHLQQWESGVHEGSWKPDEPQWGSALRAFGCDYGPERVLREAAEWAGFKVDGLDLPMKTTMWVNPGIVRVAEGYSAEPVTIWTASEASSDGT